MKNVNKLFNRVSSTKYCSLLPLFSLHQIASKADTWQIVTEGQK